MLKTTVIPTGTASATTQELLVEIVEPCCRPYCINSSIQPSATVTFSTGTVKVLGGNALVPVVATVTIVTPSPNGCGCAHTQVLTEEFDLGFDATTANTITLTQGTGTMVEPANIKCCKAKSVRLVTTLTATIA